MRLYLISTDPECLVSKCIRFGKPFNYCKRIFYTRNKLMKSTYYLQKLTRSFPLFTNAGELSTCLFVSTFSKKLVAAIVFLFTAMCLSAFPACDKIKADASFVFSR